MAALLAAVRVAEWGQSPLAEQQACSGLGLALKQRFCAEEPSVVTMWEGFIIFIFHHLRQRTQELEGETAGRRS